MLVQATGIAEETVVTRHADSIFWRGGPTGVDRISWNSLTTKTTKVLGLFVDFIAAHVVS